MSNREVGPVAKELIAAKKRIEDPENWQAGAFGFGTGRWCAVGAIFTTHRELGLGGAPHDATSALSDAGYRLFKRGSISVNDELGHAAVMQMYDHAIQRALSGGK